MHLFIGKCKDDGMGIEENYTQDCYFVTKIVLTYCEKKNLVIESIFDITGTIYLNSEMSEQFLVKQNAFLTCSWGFSYLIN